MALARAVAPYQADGREEDVTMRARVGDELTVRSLHQGDEDRHGEIVRVDGVIAELRRNIGAAFRRGLILPDRHYKALQVLLARELHQVLIRSNLLTDALVFRERIRTTKSVTVIRNAR